MDLTEDDAHYESKYAYGPVHCWLPRSEFDDAAAKTDDEKFILQISYTVSDDLSIFTYGSETIIED